MRSSGIIQHHIITGEDEEDTSVREEIGDISNISKASTPLMNGVQPSLGGVSAQIVDEDEVR